MSDEKIFVVVAVVEAESREALVDYIYNHGGQVDLHDLSISELKVQDVKFMVTG